MPCDRPPDGSQPPATPPENADREVPADPLTPAQRAFARVLGRGLAALWHRDTQPRGRPKDGSPGPLAQ